MEEIFINMNDLDDIEELKYALKENIIKANKIRKEIEVLKNVELKSEIENDIYVEDDVCPESAVFTDDTEYEYYYDNINKIQLGITLEQLKEHLKENLPSRNNSNYGKLINRIKAEIYKEIIELSNMSDESIDKEFLDEIKNCIELEKNKLKLIDEIDLEEEAKEVEIQQNDIVFLETNAGNIYAIQDLEDIEKEFYNSFKELYNSIKNGTFKNAKRFRSSNNKLNGLLEVRGFQTRIIFDRLDKNTYVIIQAFIKKCDNDKGYRDSLINRCSIYRNNKNEILEQLQDSSYKAKNEQFESQLLELLDEKTKRIKKVI